MTRARRAGRAIFALVVVVLAVSAVTPSSGAVQSAIPSAPSIVAVSSGELSTTCATMTDATVDCWGSNADGLLGLGVSDTNEHPSPSRVPGLTSIAQVTVGSNFVCALSLSGVVRCWGQNGDGQLGDGTTRSSLTPVVVSSVRGVRQIAASNFGACALLSTQTVACWGRGSSGQLGDGTTASSDVAVTVKNLTDVTAISAGGLSACALVGGAGWCWGSNSTGQLGNGTVKGSSSPVSVRGLSAATQIGVGFNSACALVAAGAVKCWGSNAVDQVANSTVAYEYTTPASVGTLSGATDIVVGSGVACALLGDQSVSCWGSGDVDGLFAPLTQPTTMAGLSAVTSLSGSTNVLCASTASSTSCWGSNIDDALGTAVALQPVEPTPVLGVTTATQVVVGDGACALLVTATVTCWGPLGSIEAPGTTATSPTPVAGLTNVVQLSAFDDSVCAVITTGAVECWGSDANDQIGTPGGATPRAVSAITSALSVSVGLDHTCAVLSSGAVACWGQNAEGQLGIGSTKAESGPVIVAGISNAIQVASGDAATCVLLANQSVQCWGVNENGLFGHGVTVGQSDLARSVPNVSHMSSLSLSTSLNGSACGLTVSHVVECWTAGTNGVNGTNAPAASFQSPLAIVSGASGVATGEYSTCAVVTGRVQCWGATTAQQVGTGPSGALNVSRDVLGVTAATQVAVNATVSCALLVAKNIECWGSNADGSLGIGVALGSPTPQVVAVGERPSTPEVTTPIVHPGRIIATWAPSVTNGSPVTHYVATAIGPTTSTSCSSARTSCALAGLSPATAYTIAVTATSAGGTSATGLLSYPVVATTASVPTSMASPSVVEAGFSTDEVVLGAQPGSIASFTNTSTTCVVDAVGQCEVVIDAGHPGSFSFSVRTSASSHTSSASFDVPRVVMATSVLHATPLSVSITALPAGALVSLILSDGRVVSTTASSAGVAHASFVTHAPEQLFVTIHEGATNFTPQRVAVQ